MTDQQSSQSSQLLAISPIDGRYKSKVTNIENIASEYAFIKYRVKVEVEYFIYIVKLLKSIDLSHVKSIYNKFTIEECQKIKDIEQTINHDVKSIEYYVKDKITELGCGEYKELVHFCLTSNDINSLAYSMQMKDLLSLYKGISRTIVHKIHIMGVLYKDLPMLSRTHGQPATPTTLGKELLVFYERLTNQLDTKINIRTKFGGAVGNLAAHHVTYPSVDWPSQMDNFIKQFDIQRHCYTTQIDHYDNHSEVFDLIKRTNVILVNFCQSIWLYNSLNYFKLKINDKEVGSSAMPHKVNPIDFENAEGNLQLANALLEFFTVKLPNSRLQRDLSDSTVMRNIGVAFAHSVVAIKSIINGLGKLQVNKEQIEKDLNDNWIVVSEAIQCVLRRDGYDSPYEKLKELTRTHDKVGKEEIHKFIDELDILDEQKEELKKITPFNYIGYN